MHSRMHTHAHKLSFISNTKCPSKDTLKEEDANSADERGKGRHFWGEL